MEKSYKLIETADRWASRLVSVLGILMGIGLLVRATVGLLFNQ